MSKRKYPYIVKKVIAVTTYGDGRVKYTPYVVLKENWWIWPTNSKHGVGKYSPVENDYYLSAFVTYDISFETEEESISALKIAVDSYFKGLLSTEVVSYVEKYI